eukprot:m.52750 g.52750  ORF g.52750 m.52750 type:complete len:854 (-) comp11793_c0_seq1:188-2749(-)
MELFDQMLLVLDGVRREVAVATEPRPLLDDIRASAQSYVKDGVLTKSIPPPRSTATPAERIQWTIVVMEAMHHAGLVRLHRRSRESYEAIQHLSQGVQSLSTTDKTAASFLSRNYIDHSQQEARHLAQVRYRTTAGRGDPRRRTVDGIVVPTRSNSLNFDRALSVPTRTTGELTDREPLLIQRRPPGHSLLAGPAAASSPLHAEAPSAAHNDSFSMDPAPADAPQNRSAPATLLTTTMTQHAHSHGHPHPHPHPHLDKRTSANSILSMGSTVSSMLSGDHTDPARLPSAPPKEDLSLLVDTSSDHSPRASISSDDLSASMGLLARSFSSQPRDRSLSASKNDTERVSLADLDKRPFEAEILGGQGGTLPTTASTSFESTADRDHDRDVRQTLARTFSRRMSIHRCSAPLLPSDECSMLMTNIDSWELDIFALTALSQGRPLALLAMKIMHDRGLIETLRLDVDVLARFFMAIEDSYERFPKIQYHNNQHGADVMHSVHVLLDTPGLLDCFSDIEMFAALVAAAVHDVNHPGRTNAFLVKTSSPLAVLYNDASVLENHHLATAFKIMGDERCNILKSFEKDDRLVVRRLMIDMVLSTDMVKHAKFLGEFNALLHSIHTDPAPKEASAVASVIRARLRERYEDRVLVLCNIVHSADLGSATKPWPICQKWTQRVINEFYEEGDEERRLGLEIGPLNDREKLVVPKAQVGFINFVALPLWEAWARFVAPGTPQDNEIIQLRHLRYNLNAWKRLADDPNSEPTPAPPFSDMPRLQFDLSEGGPGDGDLSSRASSSSLSLAAGMLGMGGRVCHMEPALSPIVGSPAPLLEESPTRSVHSRDGSLYSSPERLLHPADSS